MINAKTGALALSSLPITLSSEFEKSRLSTLPIAGAAKNINGVYGSHSLGVQEIGGPDFWTTLYFCDEKLHSIELVAAVAKSKNWNEWSEAEELLIKAKHDAFLIEQTGRRSHKYAWGEIVSGYDARSGSSSIIIRYL